MWTLRGCMWTPREEAGVDTGWIDLGTGGQVWEPRVGERNCWAALRAKD